MNAIPKNILDATRLLQEGKLQESLAVLRGGLAKHAAADPAAGAHRKSSAPSPSALAVNLGQEKGEASPGLRGASTFADAQIEGESRLQGRWHRVLDRFGQTRPALGLDKLIPPGVARAPAPLPDGARFEQRIYANAAGSRTYKLYIPSGYKGEAIPLVVMLHGCTQSPDDFAAGTRMNEVAEERLFLIAYPAQSQSANASKCWNWFNTGDQQRGQGEPSLIAGITRQVISEFAVDPERVYVAGLSAGGAAAAIMGSAYPDLYAAIGVHSGLACGAASDVPSAFKAMRNGAASATLRRQDARAIPTIVFHGDADTTVNRRNGDQIIVQSRAAADLRTNVSRGAADGMSYTRHVHVDDSGNPVLEHWIVHGLGHAWSGGSPNGSYTDARGPDATREMLRFFLQNRVSARQDEDVRNSIEIRESQ